MSRDEGIKMVKKYDHVVSSDLDYWLDYVKMDKDEFWRIADTLEVIKFGGLRIMSGINIIFGEAAHHMVK